MNEEVEEVGRMPERAMGNRADHISASSIGVPSPKLGCWGGGVLPALLKLSAEQGLTGRRAGTQSSHLTLLPPPSGLRLPKLNRGAFSTAPPHALKPEPGSERTEGEGTAPEPQAVSGVGSCSRTGALPRDCGAREARGEPSHRYKVAEKVALNVRNKERECIIHTREVGSAVTSVCGGKLGEQWEQSWAGLESADRIVL